MYNIIVSKDFERDFKILIRWRVSLKSKIQNLYSYLENNWINQNIWNFFDIQDLWDWYFRFKFIPIRVIVKVESDKIILKKIFKRKWKSDYKFFKN